MSERYFVPGCDEFCALRHGKGYHQNDIKWLFTEYLKKRAEVNGPLRKAEILELFDKLDQMRGRPPEWRKK